MIDIMDVAGEGNGLVTISANDSSTCVNLWGPETFLIDQAGSFMEGLAVLPGDTTFGQQNVSVDSLSVLIYEKHTIANRDSIWT